MTRLAVWRLAVWALAALILTACDPGDDVDVDPAESTAALESQRADVRELLGALATGAASALGGRVGTASGHWEGCDSVFPEGHRNFRYRASARIEAGPAAVRPYLDALAAGLEEAGMADATSGDRPGGRTLGGTRGEIEVRFSELPAQGDYVLLDASGPCVDVPEDEREEWEGRPDPTPIVE
jgi:hypothetical protein